MDFETVKTDNATPYVLQFGTSEVKPEQRPIFWIRPYTFEESKVRESRDTQQSVSMLVKAAQGTEVTEEERKAQAKKNDEEDSQEFSSRIVSIEKLSFGGELITNGQEFVEGLAKLSPETARGLRDEIFRALDNYSAKAPGFLQGANLQGGS